MCASECIHKHEPDQIATQYFTRNHKKLEISVACERNMLLSAVLWKHGVITGLKMCFNFCLYVNIRNHSTTITTKRNVIKKCVICAQRQHARTTDVHQIPTNCCWYVWYDEDSQK